MAEAAAVEARRSLGFIRHVALSTPWLGQFYALTPIYTILLPVQVAETVTKGWQGIAVGAATGAGGLLALTLPPLVGYWSDGMTSRFGRRRPFLVAGTVGMVGSCLILVGANSYPTVSTCSLALVFAWRASFPTSSVATRPARPADS